MVLPRERRQKLWLTSSGVCEQIADAPNTAVVVHCSASSGLLRGIDDERRWRNGRCEMHPPLGAPDIHARRGPGLRSASLCASGGLRMLGRGPDTDMRAFPMAVSR